MLSYISPNSSAAPSPRACISPLPFSHTHKHLTSTPGSRQLSPDASPQMRGIVHPVTPPLFALASEKPSVQQRGPAGSLGFGSFVLPPGAGGSGMGYGQFDYESEGSTFPAKRMTAVKEAVRELETILMGDVESSSSSSSSEDERDPREETEMKSVGIVSGRKNSMVPRAKPSKGWRKGVARESVRFQLLVDVPCWEPGCYSDLSSMHALRDKTLKALHDLIDSLHIRGIRTTYRLNSTANGGAWGCIRVAPFMSSSHPAPTRGPTSPLAFDNAPLTPGKMLLSMQSRRATVAGPGMFAAVGGSRVEAAQKREMDEKERVAKRVKKALEHDGGGIVEENRTYLLPVNGQPALVLT